MGMTYGEVAMTEGLRKSFGIRLHNFTKYKKEWLHYQIEDRNLKM
jgi:hypothetical protein